MDTTITNHIRQHPVERQPLIKAIHEAILANDPSVVAVVGSMMGKEMILYNDRDSFKYGLAGTKEHISLHVLPMYMDAALYTKFVEWLPKAKFQKGCVNFKNAVEMPVDVAARLIAECAPVDLIAKRQALLDSKKKKK